MTLARNEPYRLVDHGDRYAPSYWIERYSIHLKQFRLWHGPLDASTPEEAKAEWNRWLEEARERE